MSESARILRLAEETAVFDLSAMMEVPPAAVIRAGLDLPRLLTIHELLNFDEATRVAKEFDFRTERR